mgnify:CR=1 FL=1
MNNQQIFSLWYKQPSMLTNTPQIALMIRKEGYEAYGLYIAFADSLHLVGGYKDYDFENISLILNCTKKLIKAKLKRVLIEYKLFDFYTDDDGIEMIGLQRVKDDIDAMNKSKQDGAKGGLKRAENARNRTKPMEVSPEIKKNYITIDNMIRTIPDGFYTTTKEKQLGYIDNLRQKNEPIEFINFVIQSSKK